MTPKAKAKPKRKRPAPPEKTSHAKELEQAKQPLNSSVDYALDHNDRLVLQRVLDYPGITRAEIARSFSHLSTTRVGTIMAKPAFQQAVADMNHTADDYLKAAALRGARRLKDLVESPNDETALAAIKIALGPSLRPPVQPNASRKMTIQTTVSMDGSLLQTVIDEDAAAAQIPAED